MRAAIRYGIDTRATAQIARLDAELDREAVLERCGSSCRPRSIHRRFPHYQRYMRGYI